MLFLARKLQKAHISAYQRTDSKTGASVGVKEHEDKRPAAQIHPAVAREWSSKESISHLRESVLAVGQSLGFEPGGEPQKPTVLQRDTPQPQQPGEKPAAKPQQPQAPPMPPQAYAAAMHLLNSGGRMGDAIKNYRELKPVEKETIDHWLVATKNPLASQTGTAEERFTAWLTQRADNAKRLDAERKQTKQEEKKEPDTRAPSEKFPEATQTVLKTSAAEQQAVTQQAEVQSGREEFAQHLDKQADGVKFIIPVASAGSKMIGTWEKVTVGGENFWKKGSIYRPSTDFATFRESIARQLAEAPKTGKMTADNPVVLAKDAQKPAEQSQSSDYVALPSEPGQKYAVGKVVEKIVGQTDAHVDAQKIRAALERESTAFVEKDVPLHGLKDVADVDVDPVLAHKEKGAIVVAADGTIIDGRHRAAAALAAGETTIRALVPIKQSNALEPKKQKSEGLFASFGRRLRGIFLKGRLHKANTPREYAIVMAHLPVDLTQQVQQMASRIFDHDLAGKGREQDSHITVLFGLHGDNAEAVQHLLRRDTPLHIRLGKTSLFPPSEGSEGAEVVKIDVESPDLHWLHEKIATTLPHTDTHPDYRPHITLAYLRPGTGQKYVGMDDLEGQTALLDTLVFSDTQKQETPIRLGSLVLRRGIFLMTNKAYSRNDEQQIGAE